jgi:hypothetical protein
MSSPDAWGDRRCLPTLAFAAGIGIHIADHGYKIALFVKNLFNRVDPQTLTSNAGVAAAILGDPRFFGRAVTAHFEGREGLTVF